MDGLQLGRELRRAGFSDEDLAREMGVTRREVTEWQHSQVPRRYRKQVQWHIATWQQMRSLEQSGIPECEWIMRWSMEADRLSDNFRESTAELEAHRRDCEVCQRRERFLSERFGPTPEYPMGLGIRTLGLVADASEATSRWSRTVVVLAAVSALFASARLLRHLPWYEPVGIVVYLLAVSVTAVIGLSVYYGLKPLHRGSVGRWLARCAAGTTAMVGFSGVFIVSGYGSLLDRSGDPVTWSEGLVIGAGLGLLYATLWPLGELYHRRDPRPRA